MTPGYGGSIGAVCAVVGAGVVLQLVFGEIVYSYLRWPVSGFAGVIFILAVAALAVYRDSRFFRWISGVRFNVVLIGALTVVGIVMGLIPQAGAGAVELPGLPGRLGLLSVTRSWPFALVYLTLLISLGTVVVRRGACFRWADYAFYLNHFGLWLLMFAAGLGTADLRRHKMLVPVGGWNGGHRVRTGNRWNCR
ncbi:MAG: hypothetical protein LUD76_02600 [Alistipes sp.]|nr:hypothetical protein [Alistipes sp.]